MTAVTAPGQAPDLREAKGWRRTKNRIMTVLMVTAFVITLIVNLFARAIVERSARKMRGA